MILSLNAGSSSLKFALFHRDGSEWLRGEVEGIGTSPKLHATTSGGDAPTPPNIAGTSHEEVLAGLLPWLEALHDAEPLAAVGHRIVHGGDDFFGPVRIDDAVLARIEALVPLAPLHQPHGIAAIRAVTKERPALPQVACFDTSFHRTMPPVATRIAVPRALGVRRYGFHGLSYEFIAGRLAELAPSLAKGRVIVAHLGSGASLCAMAGGRSIATTMGFSALDGLVMGTRPGSLDPGVILYLMQSRGMDAAAIEDMLYHQSGLHGLSGLSSDMRELAKSTAPEAADAIELFCYRAAAEMGALAVCLGGLDGVVFTGGIGEHDAEVRGDIGRRLACLGLDIDAVCNAGGRGIISAPESRVAAWVIPTDEEAVIARHAQALLA